MLPRRLISELAARYRLAPDLREIFVEGEKDKRYLDRAHGAKDQHCPVYPITTIELPKDVLDRQGFTEGNRQRVIALFRELGLPNDANVRFLVDRDLDTHLGANLETNLLRYTKFADCEAPFLTSDILEKIIVYAARVETDDWNSLFESIGDVLKRIYCFRLAVTEMNLFCGFPKIEKSLSFVDGVIKFDRACYLSRFNPLGVSSENLKIIDLKQVHWFDRIASDDPRFSSRGHDCLDVIRWLINSKGKDKKVKDALESFFVMLIPEVASDFLEPVL